MLNSVKKSSISTIVRRTVVALTVMCMMLGIAVTNNASAIVAGTLTFYGSAPTLATGQSYDLSQVTLVYTNSQAQSVTLTGAMVTWNIIPGGSSLYFTNSKVITGYTAGVAYITATYNGVTSSPIAIVVGGVGVGTISNLRNVYLTGTIPTLTTGGTYNLSQLTLQGYDAYGSVVTIPSSYVTWSIASATGTSSVVGSTLYATGYGTGYIYATVSGISSNTIPYTVGYGTPAYTNLNLRTLGISGVIPALTAGDRFDLSRLTLTGYDVYGNYTTVPSTSVVWTVNSGWGSATVVNGMLRANSAGAGTLTATVNGVVSNQLSFTVGTYTGVPTNVTRLNLTGVIPTIAVGDAYDLSKLYLTGYDAYGNTVVIPGQSVTWSILYGGTNASIIDRVLTPAYLGTGSLMATVNGVMSNAISFTVGAYSGLTTNTYNMNVTLTGTIPNLNIGDVYDLSKLTLSATDLYGNYTSIVGQTINWSILTGGNCATIAGNKITATKSGKVTVSASVLGVSSNALNFNVNELPKLATLSLTGTQPELTVKKGYDLSKLTISGKDQYGNAFDISKLPVTWTALSNKGLVDINGNIITASGVEAGTVTAVISGIRSNALAFTAIKEKSILTRLILSGSIPSMKTGEKNDLSKLSLRGIDQNGENMALTGLSVEWSIGAGKGTAAVAGNLMTATSAGTGTVVAKISGVSSNELSYTVVNPTPVLKKLTIDVSNVSFVVGKRFNLSTLKLNGIDQFGNPFTIDSKYVNWKNLSSNRLTMIIGKNASPLKAGKIKITATYKGITSAPVTIIIKAK